MRKAEQHAAGYLLRKLQTIRHAKCPGSPQTGTIRNTKHLDNATKDGLESLISQKAHAKKRHSCLIKRGVTFFHQKQKVKVFDVHDIHLITRRTEEELLKDPLSRASRRRHWNNFLSREKSKILSAVTSEKSAEKSTGN